MMAVVSFFLQLSSLVLLAMLLLLAGDVERNPGPLHGLKLEILVRELTSAEKIEEKWHEIGVQLEIPIPQLSDIEVKYPSMIERLTETLRYWLEGNTKTPICWESILACLRASTVSKRGLAEELQQKFCHGQHDQSGGSSRGDESLSCSKRPKLYMHSFPYLDLSTCAIEAESEGIQAKLYSDFHNMTKKFQKLIIAVGKSLEKEKKSAADILACVSQFKTLEPVYTDLHSRPFRHQFPKLNQAKTITQAMSIISDYTSFFNYSLIELIVVGLGTDEDKGNLESYKKEFQEYAKRSVFECPPELGVSGKDWPSFLIKVHHKGFEECSLDHLHILTEEVAHFLHLPTELLVLDSVTPGCLELTLQVPLPSYQNIFPLSTQQEEALAALGVIKISAGNYQYPSHQVEDGDDDSPRKPDNGPDGDFNIPSVTAESGIGSVLSHSVISPIYPYSIEAIKRPIDDDDDDSVELSTPLHLTALNGHLEAVKLLLKKGFELYCKDVSSRTALHYAAHNGHLNVVELFCAEYNFDPDIQDKKGWTPLHFATQAGHVETMKYLIDVAKCNPEMQDNKFGRAPLHIAAIGGHLEAIKLLLDKGCNPLLSFNDGDNILHIAAYCGQLEVVKFLITELEFDFDIPGVDGLTPLHCAAEGGHLETMKYLIDTITKCKPSQVLENLQIRSHKGFTPLHIAATNGHLEAIKLLLYEGCDPFCKDVLGSTPLHLAAFKNQLNVVKFFITKLNFDPNIQEIHGMTPFDLAILGGDLDTMKYLIDITKFNLSLEKTSPLHLAAECGNLEAIKLLLDKGYDLACQDSHNNTPLHVAAINGHLNVVKFFIAELKFNPQSAGCGGRTPFYFAAENGHVDVMEYLIDMHAVQF